LDPRLICVFALTLVPVSANASAASATPAAPWLFVSDVHLDPLEKNQRPSYRGEDTNEPLLKSALAAMKRADPAPPVVVISGDFLGHGFENRYVKTTMAHLARAFGEAFPSAQFILALGNEDSPCGDYYAGPNPQFLRETAAAWEPLVNRNGAAPGFLQTFSRDGFYTAKLPLPGLRAVVVDDVFWARRFRSGCGAGNSDGATEQLADLERALPPGDRDKTWVVLHIPPGVDAFSTIHIVHHLVVVPFLDSAPQNRLLSILGDRRRNVSLLVAGHTHKFAFRLIDPDGGNSIPVLLVPAISPIFGNNPMFLTVRVAAGGAIGAIEEHAYDDDHEQWYDAGGSKDLGLEGFSGAALANLRSRLAESQDLRATFARLYDGGAPPEISVRNWRGYWCAIESMSDTAYRTCMGERGYGFLTGRGFAVIGFAALGVLLIATAGTVLMRRTAR
jgi:hypothetical protein